MVLIKNRILIKEKKLRNFIFLDVLEFKDRIQKYSKILIVPVVVRTSKVDTKIKSQRKPKISL